MSVFLNYFEFAAHFLGKISLERHLEQISRHTGWEPLIYVLEYNSLPWRLQHLWWSLCDISMSRFIKRPIISLFVWNWKKNIFPAIFTIFTTFFARTILLLPESWRLGTKKWRERKICFSLFNVGSYLIFFWHRYWLNNTCSNPISLFSLTCVAIS